MSEKKIARPRPFVIRSSRIQGRGAFARERIRKGTRLIEYTGEHITHAEADRRYPDDEMDRHHTFLFELDDDTIVDAAVGGNVARYINHSCDPNCEAVIEDGHIYIDAIRDIRPGQELLYDYSYILEERHTPAVKARYPCYCGSRKCRGTILGKKR
jgi:SET domain-containing protein